MAIQIKPDGTEIEVHPANASEGFTLEELYGLTECDCIDIVFLSDRRRMVVDDNGLLKDLPLNLTATRLYRRGRIPVGSRIVGTVLVGDGREIQ